MSQNISLLERAEGAAPEADDIVAKLPGRVRDIATLRGLGYTCLEIGRRFGISAQAVSATLSRHHRRVGDFGAGSEVLELSARAANALTRLGIERRADARGRDVFALLRRERNCGEKTLEEIRRWLERGVPKSSA
jgi:DNA-binding CsgD family transcriptional regulator